MIQPQDLRIGNWVWEDYGGEYEVRGVLLESNYKLTGVNIGKPGVKTTGSVLLTALKPIELTEQRLRDFGFIVTFSGNLGWWRLFKDNDCLFDMFGFEGLFYFNYRKSYEVELKYVHQLQNLFYALTGNELTLKRQLKYISNEQRNKI